MRKLVLSFCVALLLPACSTITTSPGQKISVITEPAGAVCEIERDGDVIGIVNPTPGNAFVDRSVRDVGITCSRAGYERAATVVQAGFQPMTLGNVLIGGLVGLAVDSASGAIAQYPRVVRLRLEPEPGTQRTLLRQDAGNRLAEADRLAVDEIAAINAACAPQDRARCARQVEEVRARQRAAREFSELQIRRVMSAM
jgi:hypothetical protein